MPVNFALDSAGTGSLWRRNAISRLRYLASHFWIAAGWLIIFANYLYFAAPAVHSHFAPDEMMNMGWAWEAGLPRILRGLIEFWSGFYRPMGALYYWLFYHFCGLNPTPIRVFDLILTGFNLVLVYGTARLLGLPRFVAWLTTFFFSYQARIYISLIYNGAYAYDRIFFTFYFAALIVYLRARRRDEVPGWGRVAGIGALYIGALDAKEMAVSLPLVILCYELLWNWRDIRIKGLARWIRTAGRTALILAAMTVVYVAGKTQTKNVTSINPIYQPHDISLSHLMHSQSQYMKEFLFHDEYEKMTPPAAAIFGVLFAAAILLRDRTIGFCGLFTLLTPLPIAFIHRGGGCLYVVWAGWALLLAYLLYRVALAASERLRLNGSRRVLPFAVAGTIAVASFVHWNRHVQHYLQRPALANGDVTWKALNELDRVRPRIPSHSTVAYLRTPFQEWYMLFATELWLNDPTVRIVLDEHTPLSEAELAKADVILTFDGMGDLHELKP